jgi:hypothetical protein
MARVKYESMEGIRYMDAHRASHPHVARIAAGKAKRKGRHTGGRNKA